VAAQKVLPRRVGEVGEHHASTGGVRIACAAVTERVQWRIGAAVETNRSLEVERGHAGGGHLHAT